MSYGDCITIAQSIEISMVRNDVWNISMEMTPASRIAPSIALSGVLGCTSVLVFTWLSVSGWDDHAGLMAACIFAGCALFQALFTLIYWKYLTSTSTSYKQKKEEGIELQALQDSPH